MATPRKVGREKWSAKNDTWTDRNGVVTEGMSAKGLTASDISDLVEVREDNREAIAEAIDQALATALKEVGLVAEGYAKRACPVDTGRLRNSTTHIVDEVGKCAVIGTNVEYAPYVELGTRHQKPQPYLKPAAKDHAPTYRAIMQKHLGG